MYSPKYFDILITHARFWEKGDGVEKKGGNAIEIKLDGDWREIKRPFGVVLTESVFESN